MNDAVTTAEKPAETPAPKVDPVVDPARVVINTDGFGYRMLMARMPLGVTAEHLKDPAVWKKLQGVPTKALRRHDHLYIVGFDETWAAEAIVGDADQSKAVLVISKIFTFPARFDRLFEDEKYKVQWDGVGYVVVRKSDSRVVSHVTHHTAALAERELAAQYPRVA